MSQTRIICNKCGMPQCYCKCNGIKPQLCGVRNEIVNLLLFENDPSLNLFEKWVAKGQNAAIKKVLKIIDAHSA